jgi:hypothetical protein
MFTIRRTIRALTALSLAFAATATTACGGSDKSTGPGDGGAITGNYALQQVDGSGLPATIFDDIVEDEGTQYRLVLQIASGNIALEQNGRFSGTLRLRITANGQTQEESLPTSGTYTRSGNTITFDSDDAEDPIFQGTVAGARLDIRLDLLEEGQPIAYTFRK